MIRLIATDMDGTLLNDKMQVSDGNAAAIRAAQAAGIEFMVATGRGLTEAKPLLAAQDLHPAFITLNGARVFDQSGQLAVEAPLTVAALHRVLTTLRAQHLYFELVTDRGIYSDSKPRRIQNVADVLVRLNPDTTYKIAVALAAARLELMHINYTDDYDQLLATPGLKVLKILAFASGNDAGLAAAKAVLVKDEALVITSSAANNIEINDVAAQKGDALAAYAAKHDISMSDVMAIGDNLNDESMIRMAGIGVAMGNAIPTISALANWHTGTNTADGVGQAIRRAIALGQEEG